MKARDIKERGIRHTKKLNTKKKHKIPNYWQHALTKLIDDTAVQKYSSTVVLMFLFFFYIFVVDQMKNRQSLFEPINL